MAEVTRQVPNFAGMARWRVAAGTFAIAAIAFGNGALAQEKKAPQSAWVKICDKAPVSENEKKEICITHHESLEANSGMVLVSAAIRKVEGQDKERFLVMVPLGMAIPPGLQVRIDEQEEPIKMRFSICHPGGCTAEIASSPELLDKLRKGSNLTVAAINAVGKAVGFKVSLSGFTKAYEGGPVDSKKYAEARRQLMQSIRQRQIKKMKEQQKKQENN